MRTDRLLLLLALAAPLAACGGPISRAIASVVFRDVDFFDGASQVAALKHGADDLAMLVTAIALVAPAAVALGPDGPDARQVVDGLARNGHAYRVLVERRGGERTLQALLAREDDATLPEGGHSGHFTVQGLGSEQGWLEMDLAGRRVICVHLAASAAERAAQIEELAHRLAADAASAAIVGLGSDLGGAAGVLRDLGFVPVADSGHAWARGPLSLPSQLPSTDGRGQVLRFVR